MAVFTRSLDRSMARDATIGFSMLLAVAWMSGCEGSGASTFTTQSNSMAPTIARGDQVTVTGTSYKSVKEIKRWDIIVFRYVPRYREPGNSGRSQPVQSFVKRVVALPGETLTYSESKVLIDGKPLEIPPHLEFLVTIHSNEIPQREDTEEVVVPADSVFIIGDNIHHSRDSRMFGPVAFDDVAGKVIGVNGKSID